VSRAWICASCGETHSGLPALAFEYPLAWEQLTPDERAVSVLEPDWCEIRSEEGEYFYVRGSFEIPIRDWEEPLEFGVWSSLSAANFKRYVELYDDPARVDEPAYSSWFGNQLPGFPDTLNLQAWVEIYDEDLRPRIVLHEQDHPLVAAARDGIELAQAIALVEPAMHAV
jgi:hypothetical protein